MAQRPFENFRPGSGGSGADGWVLAFLQGEYRESQVSGTGDYQPVERVLTPNGEGDRGIASLGNYGRTGPTSFEADQVTVNITPAGLIQYRIRRPAGRAGRTAGDFLLASTNPDLRFEAEFGFDIAQGTRRTRAGAELAANSPQQEGETRDIVMTNVTGMRYRNNRVVSLTIHRQNDTVWLSVTTVNAEGQQTVHDPFILGNGFLNENAHHTHAGFTDLFNYGNALRPRRRPPEQ
jgi:hypothetical protein